MAKTWKQRYAGYARRQAQGARDQVMVEVQRLQEENAESGLLERAEARLASWDELLKVYDWAKKGPMVEEDDNEADA